MDDEGDQHCCVQMVELCLVCQMLQQALRLNSPRTAARPPQRTFAAVGTTFAVVPHPLAQRVCVLGSSAQHGGSGAGAKPVDTVVAMQSLVVARIDGLAAEAAPDQLRQPVAGASASDSEAQDGQQTAAEALVQSDKTAPARAVANGEGSAAVAPREASKVRCCPEVLNVEWYTPTLCLEEYHILAGSRPQEKQKEEERSAAVRIDDNAGPRTRRRHIGQSYMADRVKLPCRRSFRTRTML